MAYLMKSDMAYRVLSMQPRYPYAIHKVRES